MSKHALTLRKTRSLRSPTSPSMREGRTERLCAVWREEARSGWSCVRGGLKRVSGGARRRDRVGHVRARRDHAAQKSPSLVRRAAARARQRGRPSRRRRASGWAGAPRGHLLQPRHLRQQRAAALSAGASRQGGVRESEGAENAPISANVSAASAMALSRRSPALSPLLTVSFAAPSISAICASSRRARTMKR